VKVRLLLDENLSPKVAQTLATEESVDACHIRDRGMLEASDKDVLEKAYSEDRILVTANVGDFTKLAAARELHAGIVLLEAGDLRREEQLAILRRVVRVLENERDLVNRVLRVTAEGDLVFEKLPHGVP
jgi:predicted nuclease of predicted toxin-antitoxin system